MKHRRLVGEALDAVLAARIREMSAEQFVQFSEAHAVEIKNVRFVPPKIGSDGFGVFEVETRTPHYEVCFS